MDLEKLLTFVTQNLAEYYMVFIATLTKPTVRFSPVIANASNSGSSGQIAITGETVSTGSQLNPKLLGFVVISIFLGITVNALIPNRKSGPDLTNSTIIIMGCWFLHSTTLHWFCKLLRGRGSYLDTLSVSIQVLSVLYVLSSFITLLISAVLKIEQVNALALKIGGLIGFIAEHPVSVYFMTQAILLVIYLPLAIRHVHHFGWFRLLLVAVLAVFGTLFGISLYLSFGVLQAPGPVM